MNCCASQALRLTQVGYLLRRAHKRLPPCLTTCACHRSQALEMHRWLSPSSRRRPRSYLMGRQTPGPEGPRTEQARGCGHDPALLRGQVTFCVCSSSPGTFSFSRERRMCREHTTVSDEAMLCLLKSSSAKGAQPPFSVYFL